MKLNERKVEMFKGYVEKSLVEKFNYNTKIAKKKIESYNLEKALKEDTASILFFDAEYWAGQIDLNNKKFNN